MKKIAFHTLGCKLNFAETSHICRTLIDNGFVVAKKDESPDIYIVNTCSVTDVADRKCRQTINRIKNKYPDAFIIVTGCYAQVNPEEVANIDGVDLILGAKEKFDILKIMQKIEYKEQFQRIQVDKISQNRTFSPIFSAGDRTRYFLKIQDGCDYYCSYCTIPFARGRSRSASVEKTMQTVKKAIDKGAKEIIFTGVNIGDFGANTKEKFIDLVREIDRLPDEVRFRISSIEPNLLEDDIIELVAESKIFAPHFHIPLQSGSNEVLSLMKRRYSRELFSEKVEKIKHIMPDAFIGVDVIVGMRGEKPEYFEDTYNFLSDMPFSELHIFPYSEREGTKALNIKPIVEPAEKKQRSERLHLLSKQHLEAFYNSQKGKAKQVLWETTKNTKMMNGYTENYVMVSAPFVAEKINTFDTVVL